MQVEKGYAELYAWVVFTVLHYKGSFLKLADMVGAINESVPGCTVSVDKGFKFGDVVIPIEVMPSLKNRNQAELERYIIAQPESALFPNATALNPTTVRAVISHVEVKAQGGTVTRTRRQVYDMISLYLRRCLATPEQLVF